LRGRIGGIAWPAHILDASGDRRFCRTMSQHAVTNGKTGNGRRLNHK
jgi:hypothetical protein